MKKSKVFLVLFTLFLGGCVYGTSPDLAVLSVSSINRAELKEVVGDDVNLPLIQSLVGNDTFLRVEISSKENLVEYIEQKKLTVFVNESFCDMPNEVVLLGTSNVYVNGYDLSMLALSDMYDMSDMSDNDKFKLNKDGAYIYDIVLFTQWNQERKLPTALRKRQTQLSYMEYNLKLSSSEICLFISGGDMLGSYQSNVVKIKKEVIHKAMGNK